MDIQRMEVGLVTVLRFSGDIDLEGVNGLRVALLTLIKEKRANVVADLSGVGYVSYLGIGVLLERMRQMQRLGGDLKLAGLNLGVKRALHMASVTKLFSIYESESQAIDGFREAA
jgi:stage II sporulation protein AA (anti-sigma F factor antagonist)